MLGFSKQGHYRWKVGRVTNQNWEDAILVHAAWDILDDFLVLGYRFIAEGLPAKGTRAWPEAPITGPR